MADLVAALRSVHESVTNFGGDPPRAMICGQSGGGSETTTLTGMPSAAMACQSNCTRTRVPSPRRALTKRQHHIGHHLRGDRNRIVAVDRELDGAGRDPCETREGDAKLYAPQRRHIDTLRDALHQREMRLTSFTMRGPRRGVATWRCVPPHDHDAYHRFPTIDAANRDPLSS